MGTVFVEHEVLISNDESHVWRWRVKKNADFDDCVDIIYEEFVEATGQYEATQLFECVDGEVVVHLGKAVEEMMKPIDL